MPTCLDVEFEQKKSDNKFYRDMVSTLLKIFVLNNRIRPFRQDENFLIRHSPASLVSSLCSPRDYWPVRDQKGIPPPFWTKTDVVGKPLPRVDAYERVSGSAIYPSDILLPNMLYGAIVRCPYPHARVQGIDVSEAEKLAGIQ
jgi:hypothetical protein